MARRLAPILLAILLAPAASAHFGAAVVYPEWLEPQGIVVTEGEDVTFFWLDSDTASEDAVYHVHYDTFRAPPALFPVSEYFTEDAPQIAEIPASDETDTLVWPVADVPTGAYHVYSRTEDEPQCAAYRYAPTLVVVRQPGDPTPLGGIVTSPATSLIYTESTAALSVEAIGAHAPTLTLRLGELIPGKADGTSSDFCVTSQMIFDPRYDVAVDAPMEADPDAGEERWRFDAIWDGSLAPNGYYVVEATITDDTGASATFFSGDWIVLVHEELDPPDDTGGDDTGGDTGDETDDPVGPDDPPGTGGDAGSGTGTDGDPGAEGDPDRPYELTWSEDGLSVVEVEEPEVEPAPGEGCGGGPAPLAWPLGLLALGLWRRSED